VRIGDIHVFCELIEGVFKAGLWVGVILVLIVVGLVVWILGRINLSARPLV